MPKEHQAKLRQVTYLSVDLKSMRCESGLTLREISRQLNIDPSNYSKVERGLLPLSEELYQRISEVIFNQVKQFIKVNPNDIRDLNFEIKIKPTGIFPDKCCGPDCDSYCDYRQWLYLLREMYSSPKVDPKVEEIIHEFKQRFCRTNLSTGEKESSWFFPETLTPKEVINWLRSALKEKL